MAVAILGLNHVPVTEAHNTRAPSTRQPSQHNFFEFGLTRTSKTRVREAAPAIASRLTQRLGLKDGATVIPLRAQRPPSFSAKTQTIGKTRSGRSLSFIIQFWGSQWDVPLDFGPNPPG